MSIEDPTFEEFRLLAALKGVCEQYIGSSDGSGISHSAMSAGERSVDVFQKYGLIVKTPAGGVWTHRAAVLELAVGISPANLDDFREKLEPDRLDVTVRQTLIDGSFYLSGELLTLSELREFKNQLVSLLSKKKGAAKLKGLKGSVRVEIDRLRADKFECTVATHNPNVNQTVQASSHFENVTLVEKLVSQLERVEAKYGAGGKI